jgi:hypothetical protein
MTPDQMLSMVDELYSAAGVGDFDRAEKLLSDDFIIEEANSLPMAGTYKGKTALRELYTDVMGMMEVAGLERIQTTTGGDFAVTILYFKFADPNLEPAHLCERFKFKDGKICEIKPYYFEPQTVVAACEAFKRKQG